MIPRFLLLSPFLVPVEWDDIRDETPVMRSMVSRKEGSSWASSPGKPFLIPRNSFKSGTWSSKFERRGDSESEGILGVTFSNPLVEFLVVEVFP